MRKISLSVEIDADQQQAIINHTIHHMGFIRNIQYIINHRFNRQRKFSALAGFLRWQVGIRLLKTPVVYPFTEKSQLYITRGMTGATGNVYCGLHEMEDMSFLLHLLREEDLFADIGANVGSYTVLASAEIGARAYAFEPSESTYKLLQTNIRLNNIEEKVTAYNIALGAAPGKLRFTVGLDTMNHMASGQAGEHTAEVQVDTLDHVLGLKTPLLLKIDVEGFESEVLKGATRTLQQESLKAILIELNGSGKRYGYNDEDIHRLLISYGFEPYEYIPEQRRLVKQAGYGTLNTLYIRDEAFVLARIAEQRKIRIKDRWL